VATPAAGRDGPDRLAIHRAETPPTGSFAARSSANSSATPRSGRQPTAPASNAKPHDADRLAALADRLEQTATRRASSDPWSVRGLAGRSFAPPAASSASARPRRAAGVPRRRGSAGCPVRCDPPARSRATSADRRSRVAHLPQLARATPRQLVTDWRPAPRAAGPTRPRSLSALDPGDGPASLLGPRGTGLDLSRNLRFPSRPSRRSGRATESIAASIMSSQPAGRRRLCERPRFFLLFLPLRRPARRARRLRSPHPRSASFGPYLGRDAPGRNSGSAASCARIAGPPSRARRISGQSSRPRRNGDGILRGRQTCAIADAARAVTRVRTRLRAITGSGSLRVPVSVVDGRVLPSGRRESASWRPRPVPPAGKRPLPA